MFLESVDIYLFIRENRQQTENEGKKGVSILEERTKLQQRDLRSKWNSLSNIRGAPVLGVGE